MGKLIKYKHHIVKIFANFLLEEQRTKLYVKEPVGKLLFDGYEDRLLDLVIKLNLTVINLPFKKFGWFVDVGIFVITILTLRYLRFCLLIEKWKHNI